MAQIDDLLNQAAEIRDAEQNKENTALRVGQMLIAIIQHIAGFVSAEDLKAVLADYAPLQGALVHWRNSRVVCLASMGTDLDNIDGGDWQYTNHTGDIVFNPSLRKLSIVGEQGDYSVFPGVLYVNLHSRHCYVWDATTQAMTETTDSSRPTIIDYRTPPSFAQVAIGESYYFESDKVKKIAIKTSSSGTYSYDPDPKKIYVFKDTCESMIWNATTRSWITVGSNGGGGISEEDIINDLITGGRKKALSAEMGKWLAMMSGSYAQAWSRSKVVTSPFCWIWDETLSDGPIRKPIWHIGNSVFIDAAGSVVGVSAGDRPGTPSFSINGATPTDNMEVARNTQLTITPVAGAVLKYSIDDAEYITSDGAVTVTLSGSGTKTIKAYCSNSAGDSDLATLRLVVSGIPEPSFAAGPDTTITTIDNDRIVTRGGVIIITGDEELHYRVGGGTWRTVSSLHGEAPTARVTIDGDKTIEAYNTVDGENSGTVSWSFKMEALAAPSFNPATGTVLPSSGGTVELSAGVNEIYYTTDGSTPTTSSTRYTGAISVNSAMTIKAIAHDNYGDSAVATATYRIKQAKMIIMASEATTMDLGETGLTALAINAGTTTEFTPSDLGISSFADHTFPYLKFASAAAITSFDGGGAKFANLGESYGPTNWGAFYKASYATSIKGVVIDGGCIANAFRECYRLTELEISGTFSGNAFNAFQGVGFFALTDAKVKINSTPSTAQLAQNYQNMFAQAKMSRLTIANLSSDSSTTNVSTMFSSATALPELVCTTDAVPTSDSNADWLAALIAISANLVIYVPDAKLTTYRNAWGSYFDDPDNKIKGVSELSNN